MISVSNQKGVKRMGTQTLYLGTVLAAGLLSFFSPCVLPLLPVYLSQFAFSGAAKPETAAWRRLRILVKSALFVAGISVCFVLLGFGAGALGAVIGSRVFMVVMGLIVIVLGLHQTGLIHIRQLSYQKKVELERSRKGDFLGSFLLGLTFSFGWTPCIGPVLGAVLAFSATSSQPLYGGLLMAVYSLGFLVPFLALALFSDLLLTKVKKLGKYLQKLEITGGIVIILMGILLMTGHLNNILTIFG